MTELCSIHGLNSSIIKDYSFQITLRQNPCLLYDFNTKFDNPQTETHVCYEYDAIYIFGQSRSEALLGQKSFRSLPY